MMPTALTNAAPALPMKRPEAPTPVVQADKPDGTDAKDAQARDRRVGKVDASANSANDPTQNRLEQLKPINSAANGRTLGAIEIARNEMSEFTSGRAADLWQDRVSALDVGITKPASVSEIKIAIDQGGTTGAADATALAAARASAEQAYQSTRQDMLLLGLEDLAETWTTSQIANLAKTDEGLAQEAADQVKEHEEVHMQQAEVTGQSELDLRL